MRAKSLFLLVACACGMVAAVGASQLIQGQGVQPRAQMTDIFVAARVIEPSERITAGMMTLQSWPADRIPSGATNDLALLEGKYAGQRFFAGEPMMMAKIVETASAVSVQIPEGFSVVSMRADAASSVASLVRPGDRVNVMAYFTKSDQIPETGIRTVLRGVKVFAVDGRTNRTSETEPNRHPSTVSLLIQRGDEEAWALASELGKLRLSLSGPADEADSEQANHSGSSFLNWIEDHQRARQLAEMLPVAAPVEPAVVPPVEAPVVVPIETPVAAPVPPPAAGPPGFRMLKLHGGNWTEYEIPAGNAPAIITGSSASGLLPTPFPKPVNRADRTRDEAGGQTPSPPNSEAQPLTAHGELTLLMD